MCAFRMPFTSKMRTWNENIEFVYARIKISDFNMENIGIGGYSQCRH